MAHTRIAILALTLVSIIILLAFGIFVETGSYDVCLYECRQRYPGTERIVKDDYWKYLRCECQAQGRVLGIIRLDSDDIHRSPAGLRQCSKEEKVGGEKIPVPKQTKSGGLMKDEKQTHKDFGARRRVAPGQRGRSPQVH